MNNFPYIIAEVGNNHDGDFEKAKHNELLVDFERDSRSFHTNNRGSLGQWAAK